MCDIVPTVGNEEVAAFDAVRQQLRVLIDHLVMETSSFEDETSRSSPRVAVWGPVNLGIRLEGSPRMRALSRGWAVDLSGEGMGLLTPHELPRGELMYVNLEPIAGESLELPIRVIYCQQLMPSAYRVGVYFDWAA